MSTRRANRASERSDRTAAGRPGRVASPHAADADARPGRAPAPAAGDPAPSRRLQRVLDEVEALFLADGFLHWTTRQVAERLQCSKTSLYRLAPTREALFRRVVDRYLREFRAEGRRAAEEAGDWNEAVRAFLGAAVVGLRRASQAFIRDMGRFPATRERVREHQRRRMAEIERLLAAGIRAGAFRGFHPRVLAEMLFATVGRLSEPEVMPTLGLSISEAFEEAYRIFERGVLSGEKPRPRRSRAERERFRQGLRAIWPSEDRPEARER